MYKLCSTASNIEDMRFQQGFIVAIDCYVELQTELDKYKQMIEADRQRTEQMKQFTSATSQAEAMGII